MSAQDSDVTRDKFGREIKVGDVLKVKHFVGARNKQHFMFKQVIGTTKLGLYKRTEYFKVSHLDLTRDFYYLPARGEALDDYEIVQVIAPELIEDRPKRL